MGKVDCDVVCVENDIDGGVVDWFRIALEEN